VIYEWDEGKRTRNQTKHGVDFASVVAFGWNEAIIRPDDRRAYGEMRWQALGLIGQRLHVLIYTERDGNTRVISLRKANQREFDTYEAASHPTDG
jgi:uncharacterized protein